MKGLYFNKETHEYRLYDKIIPSVTQICNPDKEINMDIPCVATAINRGREIHEMLCDAFKSNTDIPDEVKSILVWLNDNYPRERYAWFSEQKGFCNEYDYELYPFAGTADLVIYEKYKSEYARNGFRNLYKEVEPKAIIEFKTGKKYDWHKAQLGGYFELFKSRNNPPYFIDLILIYVSDDNELDIKSLDEKEVREAFALKHKNYFLKNDDSFKENELSKIDNGNLELIERELDMISHLQSQIDIRQELVNKAKEALMSQMLEHEINEFEFKNMKFKVTQSHTRTLLDTQDLKESQPDIYNAFSKTIEVKPSLRITTKKEV